MTPRTTENQGLNFVIKVATRHLGLFYEAKKGLIYNQITRAYVSVRISDLLFLKLHFILFKTAWVSICGHLRVLRNLRKIEALTQSLCPILRVMGSNPSKGKNNFEFWIH